MRDYTPIIFKSQLIDGAYYKGRCRNASIARWNAKKQKFYHWRDKFTAHYVEAICAPEDDAVFDVFIAKEIITDLSGIEEIPFPNDQETETETTV